MTEVLEVEAALVAPAIPARDEHADTADVLEELIASHRAALVELAPSQAERAVRRETAWHIEELGLLLRVRDRERRTQNPAPSGVHLPERGRTHENTGTDHRAH